MLKLLNEATVGAGLWSRGCPAIPLLIGLEKAERQSKSATLRPFAALYKYIHEETRKNPR